MFINSYFSSFLTAYKYSSDSSNFGMWFIIIVIAIIILLVIVFTIKEKIWDEPHRKIKKLEDDIILFKQSHKKEIDSLKESHKTEIEHLEETHIEEIENLYEIINTTDAVTEKEIELIMESHAEEINSLYEAIIEADRKNITIIKEKFTDIVKSYVWKEMAELCYEKYSFLNVPKFLSINNSQGNRKNVTKMVCERFEEALEEQYKYKYIILLYPQLLKLFSDNKIATSVSLDEIEVNNDRIFEVVNCLSKEKNNLKSAKEIVLLKNKVEFLQATQSNLTAIPYMSQIMADYETYGLEHLARELDWGYNHERLKKVKSIREIRKDAKAMVEKNKESQYQLAYLLELFPALQDIIECEYKQLPVIKVEELTEYDASRDYLSKEEYQKLSVTERNQLALDRYKNSHNKSKWQIGRDYELYIGYQCSLKGYDVDYFGSYMGLEDLGRDLIAKKDGKTLIIQCKYWSSKKLIHEKHITQLYGTMMSYCIENNCKKSDVSGVLVTNIALSDMAKTMAEFLKIKYKENVEAGDYPCIKCNINHNDSGETKIYHLPFDQKYDATKIDKKGEFYATTVAEAEAAGFRRAFKWFGS